MKMTVIEQLEYYTSCLACGAETLSPSLSVLSIVRGENGTIHLTAGTLFLARLEVADWFGIAPDGITIDSFFDARGYYRFDERHGGSHPLFRVQDEV